MFKALYESYLSPLYWILRMFGKDTKDKYRDDIDEDKYRICLKPKSGVEAKKVAKTFKHIFHKIAGVNDVAANEALQDYYTLRDIFRNAQDNDASFHETMLCKHDLNQYVSDVFTLDVTEEERKEIYDYLKNNGHMRVVQDEYKMLQEDAEWMAVARKRDRFVEKAFIELQAADENDYDNEVNQQASGF